MELATNPYIDLEEQYQAAGWHAAFLTMQMYGEMFDSSPKLLENAVGVHTLKLCYYAFKEPHSLVPRVEHQITIGDVAVENEYRTVFTDLHGSSLDPFLMLMHNLKYENDATSMDAYYTSNFARFEKDASVCAHHFSHRIQANINSGVFIGSAIKTIQRDSAFYIGMYDQPVS